MTPVPNPAGCPPSDWAAHECIAMSSTVCCNLSRDSSRHQLLACAGTRSESSAKQSLSCLKLLACVAWHACWLCTVDLSRLSIEQSTGLAAMYTRVGERLGTSVEACNWMGCSRLHAFAAELSQGCGGGRPCELRAP